MLYNCDGNIVDTQKNDIMYSDTYNNKNVCSGYFCSFILPPIGIEFKKKLSQESSKYNHRYIKKAKGNLNEIKSFHENTDITNILTNTKHKSEFNNDNKFRCFI